MIPTPEASDWLREVLGSEAYTLPAELDTIAREQLAESLKSDVSEMIRLSKQLQNRIRERPSPKKLRHNEHIRKSAFIIGELTRGVEFWIVENPLSASAKRMREQEADGRLPPGFREMVPGVFEMEGALNGYVAVDKRHAILSRRARESGLLDYLPVHGGVTYCVKDQTACVYGFDTAHGYSDKVPRTDPAWIARECELLYRALRVARTVEHEYLLGDTNTAIAAVQAVNPDADASLIAMLKFLVRPR